jgi:uncharacterized protein
MNNIIPALIAENLQIAEKHVLNTLLLDDGATIPFISRYRKERTGGLDEVKISDMKRNLQHQSKKRQTKRLFGYSKKICVSCYFRRLSDRNVY